MITPTQGYIIFSRPDSRLRRYIYIYNTYTAYNSSAMCAELTSAIKTILFSRKEMQGELRSLGQGHKITTMLGSPAYVNHDF